MTYRGVLMNFPVKLSACLLAGLFLTVSCSSPKETPKKSTASTKDECSTSSSKKTLRLQEDDKVTYESDIKVLIKDNCISCHGKGQSSPDMTSYDSMKDSFDKIFSEVDGGTMPQAGPLPADEKEKFSLWKANKFAEDETSGDASGGDEGEEGSGDGSEEEEEDKKDKKDEEEEEEEDDKKSSSSSSSSKCDSGSSKTNSTKKNTEKETEKEKDDEKDEDDD